VGWLRRLRRELLDMDSLGLGLGLLMKVDVAGYAACLASVSTLAMCCILAYVTRHPADRHHHHVGSPKMQPGGA